MTNTWGTYQHKPRNRCIMLDQLLPYFSPLYCLFPMALRMACLSKPTMMVPSISKTGTPIWPDLAIISWANDWLLATSQSSYSMLFCWRKVLAILQYGQVGVE